MKKVLVFGSLNMDLTIECDVMPQAGGNIGRPQLFHQPRRQRRKSSGGRGQAGSSNLHDCPGWEGSIRQAASGIPGRLRSGLHLYDGKRLKQHGSSRHNRCEGDNRIILSSGANHEMKGPDVKSILEKISNPQDIFMTQYECNAQAVIDSLAAAKQHQLFTLFNPAPAKAIPPEAYKNIDLLVVNQTECEFLTGIYPTDENSCQTALNRFSAMGVGNAIITLGSRGSICRIGEKMVQVDSYSVPNVDTTAAGDAYIGALASALVREEPLEDCMRYATKAAALTITKQGAQISIPYQNEIEMYFKEE